jgi:hypothetical protein
VDLKAARDTFTVKRDGTQYRQMAVLGLTETEFHQLEIMKFTVACILKGTDFTKPFRTKTASLLNFYNDLDQQKLSWKQVLEFAESPMDDKIVYSYEYERVKREYEKTYVKYSNSFIFLVNYWNVLHYNGNLLFKDFSN